ncbi:MAG: D-tyrosyl-tRNA(Tyr) deacylase [Flavobacteriales bacterium]|jgi:D-aminoacyl-tRNA deacylase|nr:D-tyrosyl-tRNA(Tyr) deacylase [Flavobacteriales bacterium]MBT5750086.1 D-tyrosyl-tRNA(Tyr) deacylase [Flavobacteriales bacterium]
MRAAIQRVEKASVVIFEKEIAKIEQGLLVLLGIEIEDTKEDALWLASKIASLRIFLDEKGVMNKSITESGGEIIVVSQFTLHAKTKKGNRPSYIKAARPEQAIPLYEHFKEDLALAIGKQVQSGEFGADMKVNLINDGPVTILIDTKNKE